VKNSNIGKDEVTIISTGVILEGKLISNGSVRIDGTINGNVSVEGNIAIGENGEVNGELNGEAITVGGRVIGSVTAKEKLTLEAKSFLKGDLITKILVIDAGAVFDGKSQMNADQPPQLPFESKNG
jgi:cytoskeletal protein CcmA (bactofilin family)